MKVPLLDLRSQTLALEGGLTEAFTRVLLSGRFILGPEVEEFERSIAALTGAKHAIGVSSGTDAILLALMALGIGPGDEVICPSFTFFATAGCVARTGATPVFADCRAATFNLDVEDTRRRITPRTRAIIPVHLFGQIAEMDPILELAREHGLAVIEDAAQAIGATYHGRGAGSMGDFGTFSFYPSKNLGGLGDSGLLTTNSDELAGKARLLRSHGENPKYFHQKVGGNFRMDPLQAALLAVKLPNLAEYTRRRQENAAYYTDQLGKIEGGIILPVTCPHHHHIWNQYTLRVLDGKRDALRSFLAEREIGTEIYYPRPMHLQECFAVEGWTPEPLPVSERLAEECVSIPIFPDLTREQQGYVVAAIAEFLRA